MKLADLLQQYLLLKNAELIETQIFKVADSKGLSADCLNDLDVNRITFVLPTQTVVLEWELSCGYR